MAAALPKWIKFVLDQADGTEIDIFPTVLAQASYHTAEVTLASSMDAVD